MTTQFMFTVHPGDMMRGRLIEGALIVVQLGVDEVRDLSDKVAYARRTADRADEARMLNTYVEDAR